MQNIDLVPSALVTEIPTSEIFGAQEQDGELGVTPEKPTGRASVYMVGVEHDKYPQHLVWLSDIHFFGGQVSAGTNVS